MRINNLSFVSDVNQRRVSHILSFLAGRASLLAHRARLSVVNIPLTTPHFGKKPFASGKSLCAFALNTSLFQAIQLKSEL